MDQEKTNAAQSMVDNEELKKLRRAYMKEWRRKNPDKVKASQLRYYQKKMQELPEQQMEDYNTKECAYSAIDVDEAKRKRREYLREYMKRYRTEHPEIVAAAQMRYNEKRLKKLTEQTGGDNNDGERVMFSTRLKCKVADTIRDYAYTKRITIDEALTLMVCVFMDAYLEDPENEPLLTRE